MNKFTKVKLIFYITLIHNGLIKFFLLLMFLLLFGCDNKYPNLNIKDEIIPDEEFEIYSKILLSYFKINDIDIKNGKKYLQIYKYTYLMNNIRDNKSKLILTSYFGSYLYSKLIENNKNNYKLEQLSSNSNIIKNFIIEFSNNEFGIYFSRVAYDENKTNCIIYFADARILLAGRGFIVVLVKKNTYWEIKEMLEWWIS